jgi:hypothetical protein
MPYVDMHPTAGADQTDSYRYDQNDFKYAHDVALTADHPHSIAGA